MPERCPYCRNGYAIPREGMCVACMNLARVYGTDALDLTDEELNGLIEGKDQ